MATLIRGDGRTVNAYQDSIMGDFAFSGKDGIIKNIGQACELDTGTLNTVKVKSGMVVIQGRQISLDGTDSISLPVATGSTVYWTTLYLELDLSAIADDELTGKVTLKKLEYTSSYPAVPTSDNLKVQTAGRAYLGLYRFKNTANGITSSERIAGVIDSTDLSTATATKFEEIETRLDELGFKTGSVSRITGATLTKQGKYAILTIPGDFYFSGSSGNWDEGFEISFAPKKSFTTTLPIYVANVRTYTLMVFTAGSKKVTFQQYSYDDGQGVPLGYSRRVSIGYEIE